MIFRVPTYEKKFKIREHSEPFLYRRLGIGSVTIKKKLTSEKMSSNVNDSNITSLVETYFDVYRNSREFTKEELYLLASHPDPAVENESLREGATDQLFEDINECIFALTVPEYVVDFEMIPEALTYSDPLHFQPMDKYLVTKTKKSLYNAVAIISIHNHKYFTDYFYVIFEILGYRDYVETFSKILKSKIMKKVRLGEYYIPNVIPLVLLKDIKQDELGSLLEKYNDRLKGSGCRTSFTLDFFHETHRKYEKYMKGLYKNIKECVTVMSVSGSLISCYDLEQDTRENYIVNKISSCDSANPSITSIKHHEYFLACFYAIFDILGYRNYVETFEHFYRTKVVMKMMDENIIPLVLLKDIKQNKISLVLERYDEVLEARRKCNKSISKGNLILNSLMKRIVNVEKGNR